MNPELVAAIQDRAQLGYTNEQIAADLQQAGYSDPLPLVLQVRGQVPAAMPTAQTAIPIAPRVKKPVSPWFIAGLPFMCFFGMIVLWGLINLLASSASLEPGKSEVLPVFTFINSVLVPFVFGLSVIAMPICVIVAIVIAIRR